MSPENFCYWLQGLMELSNPTDLTTEQVAMIKEHLKLVFKKETTQSSSVKFTSTLPEFYLAYDGLKEQPQLPTEEMLYFDSTPAVSC